MALGKKVPIEQRVDEAGRVTERPVSREKILESNRSGDDAVDLPNAREHFTLSPDYVAENKHKINAGQAVEVTMYSPIEKYELMVREPVEVLIAFDDRADPDNYDDVLLSGMQSRSDRCPAVSSLSLYFASAPATDVEVILYSGRSADPT